MPVSPADIFTLMLEPNSGCNLSCRYCYARSDSPTTMPVEILDLSLKKVVRYAEETGFRELHLVWHGGEPLLAGVDFFRNAVRLLDNLSPDLACRHFLQTNGLGIDTEWPRFFRENEFEVGLSLDGPAGFHDRLRTDARGAGTHSSVMNAARILEEHGVGAGFNTVVSKLNSGHAREIYRFFRKAGCGFRVNPMIPGRDRMKSDKLMLDPGEYGAFLCALFEEWTTSEKNRIRVSPLDVYLMAVVTNEPSECQHKLTCIGSHLGIKADGDAVLCGRFQDHVLGSILDMTVEELFEHPVCRRIRDRADLLQDCHACVHWPVCHGGCPHNSLVFEGDFLEKDPFCPDFKKIFSRMEYSLKQLKDENGTALV